MIKVLSLSCSSGNGGAAIVASELSLHLHEKCIIKHVTQDSLIELTHSSIGKLFRLAFYQVKRLVGKVISLADRHSPGVYKSYAFLPTLLQKEFKEFEPDIVHLHWVQGEFLSIEQIACIKKPIVWTLHDLWPLSASEHHQLDATHLQHYLNGYSELPLFSPSKLTYLRKKSMWNNIDFFFVAPSHWIATRAIQSPLFRNSRITVIGNPIDTDTMQPRDPLLSRRRLSLPTHEKLILASSLAAKNDPIKGADLAKQCFAHLERQHIPYKLVTIGNVDSSILASSKRIDLGVITDRSTMADIYSAVDVTLVASRIETHSMTATESIACGTPVVAFDIGGNGEIIQSGVTGQLARPFDTDELADLLIQTLSYPSLYNDNIMTTLSARLDGKAVADAYYKLYSDLAPAT